MVDKTQKRMIIKIWNNWWGSVGNNVYFAEIGLKGLRRCEFEIVNERLFTLAVLKHNITFEYTNNETSYH